jgi:hypothetical protein
MVSGDTSFNIIDSSLYSSQIFNYEATSSYNIVIRATNNFGKFIDKTFTIYISDIVEAPIVVNEAFNITANIAISTNLLTNDIDPSGGTLTITQFKVEGVFWVPGSVVDIPSVGTVVINSNGVSSFTPNTNYYGIVPVIEYRVTSSVSGLSTSGNWTIVVAAITYVNVVNNSSSANITNITINDFSPSGISYPITPGNSDSGTRASISSTGSVKVFYSDITSNFVSVTDTSSTINCADATGTSRTFNGIALAGFGTIDIELGNGGC